MKYGCRMKDSDTCLRSQARMTISETQLFEVFADLHWRYRPSDSPGTLIVAKSLVKPIKEGAARKPPL